MARRKIRNFPSIEAIEGLINNYFDNNKKEVIDNLLIEAGDFLLTEAGVFSSLEELRDFDLYGYGGYYGGGFGFDCGFVHVVPANYNQKREWDLDTGHPGWSYASKFDYPYHTQSTTCKAIQIRKALKDLKIDDLYNIRIVLD